MMEFADGPFPMEVSVRPGRLASAALVLLAVLLVGVRIGAAQQKSKVTNLLLDSLSTAFTPDRQILVDLVEIPANTSLDRHWHPGEEFHYYLKGDPEIQVGEGPVMHPKLGTVGHVPFKAIHRAGAGRKGASILVFRVHTKGEPWRYLESDHPDDHDAVRR